MVFEYDNGLLELPVWGLFQEQNKLFSREKRFQTTAIPVLFGCVDDGLIVSGLW